MAKLLAKPPVEGLPVSDGGVTLSLMEPGRVTSVAPYAGAGAALSKALKSAHGMAFPRPGEALEGKGALCLWAGRDQALLIGAAPDAKLAAHAALTDQTDGWATLRLEGAAAPGVLARLTPLDLRPACFGPGQTARTLLGHMTVSLTCRGVGCYEVMLFRSMTATAVHELSRAMRALAARAEGG